LEDFNWFFKGVAPEVGLRVASQLHTAARLVSVFDQEQVTAAPEYADTQAIPFKADFFLIVKGD
jgi:hypothetical protein